MVGF
jgi:hypothetical protein